jgi:hypothetical protein
MSATSSLLPGTGRPAPTAIEINARASEGFDAKLAETVALLREGRATWPRHPGQQPGRRGHGDYPPDQRPCTADLHLRAGNRRAACRDAGPAGAAPGAAGCPPARPVDGLPPRAGVGGPVRRARRQGRDVPEHRTAQGLLRHSQDGTAGPRPGRPESLADRAAPRTVGRASRGAVDRQVRAGREGSDQVQPAGQLDLGRRLALHRAEPGRLQPAARPVFPQHRLRALHPRHQPWARISAPGAGGGKTKPPRSADCT